MKMNKKLPLFIVTGASGAGKTTVMQELRILMPDFVIFSTDSDNFGSTAAKLEYQDRYNLLLHFANFAMTPPEIIVFATGRINPCGRMTC
jgi:Guanylate kinase